MNQSLFMNNPSLGPFGFAQGLEPVKGRRLHPLEGSPRLPRQALDTEQAEGRGVNHRFEMCMKVKSFLTGACSRILRIRE